MGFLVGCAENPQLTEQQIATISTHLLDLESRTDTITTGGECYSMSDVLGEFEPVVVSGAMQFRSKGDFLELICGTWTDTQTDAGFEVESSSVEMLSATSALVVRSGIGMARYEGSDEIRFHLVATGVWKHDGETWKRIHYHESYRDLEEE